MIKVRLLFTGSLLILFGLVGCQSTAQVDGKRYATTSMDRGDKILVIVDDYRQCRGYTEESCVSEKIATKNEKLLKKCLAKAVRNVAPGIQIEEQQTVEQELSASSAIGNEVALSRKWADILEDESQKQIILKRNIKYVVSLRMRTVVSKERSYVDADIRMPIAIVAGSTALRRTKLIAEMYDVESGRLVGELSTEKEGQDDTSVLFIGIIPLPESVDSPTEKNACSEVGESVGRFLMGAGNEYIWERNDK